MNTGKFIMALLLIMAASALYSHGTKYEIIKSGEIGIRAMYDTGEPMAGADVLVFSPGSAVSSSSLQADSAGVFYFTPDLPGTWIFQVRDNSGHAMRINLHVDDSLTLTSGAHRGGGLTGFQKGIMALCVIWGAIGTALYFKGRNRS